jgi:protein-disulfide isomerase
MSTVEGDDEQDLTRKQRREQARAQRRELEEAEAASAKRRTRLTQLGIVAGIVAAIIVAILLATGGGSKTGIPKSSKAVNTTVAEVTSLLRGIPQSGNTIGNPNAPVTLQYFGDLECPVCKAFTLGALPPLIQSYVRSGKLKIQYHSMQTASREPATFKTQQVAALAAGKQNLAWHYIELFYHQQGEENTGYVTENYLQSLARQVPGLNLAAWAAARNDPALSASITSDAQAAESNGFTGTPSFLLGKTGGTLQKFEPNTYTETGPYNAAIEKLLKG